MRKGLGNVFVMEVCRFELEFLLFIVEGWLCLCKFVIYILVNGYR